MPTVVEAIQSALDIIDLVKWGKKNPKKWKELLDSYEYLMKQFSARNVMIERSVEELKNKLLNEQLGNQKEGVY